MNVPEANRYTLDISHQNIYCSETQHPWEPQSLNIPNKRLSDHAESQPSLSHLSPMSAERLRLQTTNQFLLVLNYLFLSSMFPWDESFTWDIIFRDDENWEASFIPQSTGTSSWWLSLRTALTQPEGVGAISLQDLELQMRYLLYVIGQLSSHLSSLYSCWQRQHPPYRPIGSRASIALIFSCFMGIRDFKGYEHQDIFSIDEEFLSVTVARLAWSPLFKSGISIHQLKYIITRLQAVLVREDERMSSVLPWHICISDRDEVKAYYHRAFKSLNPELLPEIRCRWLRDMIPGEDVSHIQPWDCEYQGINLELLLYLGLADFE
jgi:hypothetical protein